MPTSDKRIKEERLKLHLELRTAQAQGKSPPWTIKQLVEVIGVQIGGGLDLPAPGKPGGREAYAGEGRSWLVSAAVLLRLIGWRRSLELHRVRRDGLLG